MIPRNAAEALAAALAALLAAPAALAQSPGDFLPGTALDPAGPAAGLEPTDPPEPAPLLAPAGPDEGPTFILRGVAVEAATAVPPAELAALWAGLLGKPVSFRTLDALAAAIGAEYRRRGFVLSQAVLPPQDVVDGVVRVQVIEGYVDRVTIDAPEGQAEAAAILFAPVPEDRPLRLETIERAVLLGRDIFGGGVDTVLEPSANAFAAGDLTVLVTPPPVVGFAAVDNRGSRLYGSWNFFTGVTAYDTFGLNEKLDVIGAAAVDGSLGYAQAALSVPLMGLSGTRLDGARLEIEADYADGEPDLARAGGAADQTLTTNESNFRIGLSVPFIRTRAQNLFGGLWLDWQDSENVTVFGDDDFTEQDRLLVLAAELSWDRATPSGVTLVKAGLRQGIDTSNTFIGGGPSNGVADFTLGTLNLARLQRLGTGPWSLWLEGIGQYGADILPNPERFALGDGTIGRGFAPGNTTGDSGYGGRIELRRQVAAETLGRLGEAAELYAYGDYGQAYDRDGERDGDRWEPLGSAGIGVRLDVRPWLSITPEIAQQLDGVPTDTRNPDLETRFFISAVARF